MSKSLENKLKKTEWLLSIHKDMIETIIQLTESVNQNSSVSDIVNIFAKNLKELMKVKHVLFLYKKENEWINLLNYGSKVDYFELNQLEDIEDVHEVISTDNIQNENSRKFSHVIPINHKNENLAYLFIKDIEIGEIDFTEYEKIRYIKFLLNVTVISLENKRLFKEFKKEKKNKVEMQMAAEVQKKLIPTDFPKSKHFQFAGKYLPFNNVGGDYYDVIQMDDEKIAFCICDISGKGISAGMLMSNFQASLRTLISRKLGMVKLVEELNLKFLKISKHERFISMFLGIYDAKTRELEYINAGHNYPILINGSKTLELEKGCTLLGIREELPSLESESLIIEKDAFLIMYTDGITELRNNSDEEFGEERLKEFAIKNKDSDLNSFNSELMDKLNIFKQKQEIFDDISLLTAKFS